MLYIQYISIEVSNKKLLLVQKLRLRNVRVNCSNLK